MSKVGGIPERQPISDFEPTRNSKCHRVLECATAKVSKSTKIPWHNLVDPMSNFSPMAAGNGSVFLTFLHWQPIMKTICKSIYNQRSTDSSSSSV